MVVAAVAGQGAVVAAADRVVHVSVAAAAAAAAPAAVRPVVLADVVWALAVGVVIAVVVVTSEPERCLISLFDQVSGGGLQRQFRLLLVCIRPSVAVSSSAAAGVGAQHVRSALVSVVAGV